MPSRGIAIALYAPYIILLQQQSFQLRAQTVYYAGMHVIYDNHTITADMAFF